MGFADWVAARRAQLNHWHHDWGRYAPWRAVGQGIRVNYSFDHAARSSRLAHGQLMTQGHEPLRPKGNQIVRQHRKLRFQRHGYR